MSRDTYKIYEKEYPYFITFTIVGWLPLFSNPKITQIILDSLHFRQNISKEFKIYAFVIMENHIHLIIKGDELAKTIASLKSYTAKQIIEYYKEHKHLETLSKLEYYKKNFKSDQKYQFWQDGYHPVQMSNRNIMLQKIEYIHNNPIKRGYVREAVHWINSSASNYFGMGENVLDVVCDW